MKTRTWPIVAGCLFLALAVGCSSDDSSSPPGDDGGSGGSGGSGGGGGTGGATLEGCRALPLPGSIDAGTWSPQFTVAGLEGIDGMAPKVYDLAVDPAGDVIATGYFSRMGREEVPALIRKHDGAWSPARQEWEVDPAFGYAEMAYGPSGELALATLVYADGHTDVLVDEGDGLRAIGRLTGQVRTMVWYGGSLWVAGNFILPDRSIAGLALWANDVWSPAPGGGPDGPVFELLADDGALLVGGDYLHVGGIEAHALASFDGTAWTSLDFDLPGVVYALARTPTGELVAGGPMVADSDSEGDRGGIAVKTETGWQLLGDGLASGFMRGVVSDLAVFHGELYVTGCFTHVGGASSSESAIRSRSIAKWNGVRWQAVDPDTQVTYSAWYVANACGDEGPDSIWNVPFQRLLATDDLLYVGGAFPGVAGTASQALIAYDGERFVPQGEPGEGLSGHVDAMAAGGPTCDVYAIGSLSHAGGVPTPGRIVRYHDGWQTLGANRPAGLTCDGLQVDDAGTIYVGCTEFPDEAPPVTHLYRIDGDDWVPLGEPFPREGLLADLALDDQGRPVVAGGSAAGWIARLENGQFQVIADDFDSMVNKVAVAPKGSPDAGAIVAAGYFTRVGDVTVNKIARFDGTSWSALGDGIHAGPMALEYGTTGIYVATGFEGDPARELLARWDGTRWIELATPENGIPAPDGETVHTFTRLMERDGKLIATGYVWPETGGRNAFLWDGTRFTAIGGGLPAISVDGAALAADGLWFGGWIAQAGGDEWIPSVGVARMTW
jgi:hypothetical protein